MAVDPRSSVYQTKNISRDSGTPSLTIPAMSKSSPSSQNRGPSGAVRCAGTKNLLSEDKILLKFSFVLHQKIIGSVSNYVNRSGLINNVITCLGNSLYTCAKPIPFIDCVFKL